MNFIVGIARFWYDFIVGEDWTIALAVFAALAVTYVVAHSGSRAVWFLLPVVVIVFLASSLWRAGRG